MDTTPSSTGPDLEAGIPVGDLVGETPLLGHAGGEPVIAGAPRRRRARDRRDLHALRRPARRGAGRRRHGSLPVAPRLLQPAHRRSRCAPRRSTRSPATRSSVADGLIARRRANGRTASRCGAARRCGPSSSSARARRATPRPRRCAARATTASITLFGADESPPVDRPNLSKDYLAGNAPEEWMPLRPPEFFGEQKIDADARARASPASTRRGTQADAGGRARRRLGRAAARDRRRAVRLPLPGADLPHVHTLRTLADSRAIIAARDARATRGRGRAPASSASRSRRRCARAASRSTSSRPRRVPLERMLGPELGRLRARRCTRSTASRFHLGQTVDRGRARRGHAVERRRARDRRPGRARRRRPAAVRAGEGGRPGRRPRRRRRRSPAHQRRRASSPRATSPAIPTRRRASRSASSTGSSRSGWGASRR